jgi:hypothetical protein
MRKQVMAIAARVSAAKRLLDAAEVHIRDAAVEEDPQHSAALLTLGGELADYAELILRAASDGPEALREPEAEVPPAKLPGGRWFYWKEDAGERWTTVNGDYSGALTQAGKKGWRLDIFRNGSVICRREYTNEVSSGRAFDEAVDFAENLMESLKEREKATTISKPVQVPTEHPATSLQWRENFNDGTYHAERDKYCATVQQAQAGEWAWRVNFDGHFRQYGTAESLTKAMQQAEDCIVARIIRNETVDAEMAVMP